MGEEEDEVKALEAEYFGKVALEDTLLFGGTLGQGAAGVSAFALAANGKLIAQANGDGSILVYDTEQFQLIRLFEGNKHTVFTHIQFSNDNCSQLLAISDGGILSTFLLKGFVPPADLQSQYIDTKKAILPEDKPLLLIPYYSVNYNHFLVGSGAAAAQ